MYHGAAYGAATVAADCADPGSELPVAGHASPRRRHRRTRYDV